MEFVAAIIVEEQRLIQITYGRSPVLVTVVSFFSFTKIQHQELTAAIAFTAISVFNELRFALNILPESFVEAVKVRNICGQLLRMSNFANTSTRILLISIYRR